MQLRVNPQDWGATKTPCVFAALMITIFTQCK